MPTKAELQQENTDLKARLAEAEETLRAIRSGEVDAVVVTSGQRDQIFTLQGTDHPYRLMVEEMPQGAVTVTIDGTILYCNRSYAEMIGYPAGQIVSGKVSQLFVTDEREDFQAFIQKVATDGRLQRDFNCRNRSGQTMTVAVSANLLKLEKTQVICLVLIDISERKRLENTLRQSEKRYRSVVNAMSEGVILMDQETRIQACNPAAERILGLSADQIEGKTTFDPRWEAIHEDSSPFPPDDHPVTVTLRTGEPMSNVVMGVHKPDGNVSWILINSQPIFNEDDEQAAAVVASFTDITARKHAQEAVRFQAQLLNAVGQAVIATDLEANVTYWNRFAEQLYGWSAAEAVGSSIMDLTPSHASRQQAEEIVARLRSGESWSGEFVVQRKDGTVFPALVTNSPIVDEQGKQIGILGVSVDVTEQKQAEAALNQAQRVAHLGSWVWHIQSDRLEWSDEMYRIFGIDKETFSGDLSKVINRAIHPEDRAKVEQSNASVVNNVVPLPLEYRVVRSDGTERVVWGEAGELIRDSDGNPAVLTGIVQDITERKAAEEKLRKLNRTLTLLSDVNQSIVRVRDMTELFGIVCRIAVRHGGFRLAWIGLPDPADGTVRPAAHAGIDRRHFEQLMMSSIGDSGGQTAAHKAVRTGDHAIVNDIAHDTQQSRWRDMALEHGYRAMAALPLTVGGDVRGVFSLYADTSGFFDDAELKLLDELASDISFAMAYAEEEAQRREAENELRLHLQVVEDMRFFLQTTLDAFPANTAVLDRSGMIISVNAAWIDFAKDNNAPNSISYVGANYLSICDMATGPDSSEAAATAAGIRAVIGGDQDDFHVEYPCHSPSQKRWFLLRATPFPEPAPRRVVIAHINITERVLTTQLIEEQKYQLNERVKELNCLYQHAKLIEQRDISPDALFKETIDLIPAAMQYPDIVTARLVAADRSFTTSSFKETRWKLASPIIVDQAQIGTLEVCYLKEPASDLQGQFLQDEQLLISELARRVGHKLESQHAAQALQKAHDSLEQKVTERTAQLQAAKEQVEAILENTVDAILLLRDDLTIERANQAFTKLFGFEPDEHGEISLITLFTGGENIQDHILANASQSGEADFDTEARRKDGSVFAAEVAFSSFEDGRYVCVVHDISQRKRIEKSLRAAVQKEKELNELKSRFVSMASHEFRTPLATIHTSTETLSAYREKLSDEQIEQKLSNIRLQVGYLTDIMDDVLRLAQLQQVTFRPETVNLDVVCRDVIQEFHDRADVSQEILYHCERGVPLAQLDKRSMRQLLGNLLSNAIKYSGREQNVSVELAHADEELVLSVKDSGIGIPEDELHLMFEPFHRGTNVGTIHGTGLGLVIAKEAVDVHQGTIVIDSEINKGTTVTVRIPIEPEENEL